MSLTDYDQALNEVTDIKNSCMSLFAELESHPTLSINTNHERSITPESSELDIESPKSISDNYISPKN